MKVLCLGGAGKISSEAVRDLVAFSNLERITIADIDATAAVTLANELADRRVDACPIDIMRSSEAVALMRPYDIVMDGTTIRLNDQSTACIAEAGCHGIDLNGFGGEYKYDHQFKENRRTHIPGFGMTPGVTNMMVKHAADQMETVSTVRVNHGAFRPIAFSPSITETTNYEYDPDLPGRVVFENGRFIQVPPFARPRDIALPDPFGTHPQWIIPHAETVTVHEYLKEKGVELIEVRGTWPPENMRLVRALYDFGFFRNDTITMDGQSFGIIDAVGAYLQQAPEGIGTDLYGYALHVQVVGTCHNRRIEQVLTSHHPFSDGSVPEWEGLRAYTRSVGIPMAIGVKLIVEGRAAGTGVITPERAFEPEEVFVELERRGISIERTIRDIGPL